MNIDNYIDHWKNMILKESSDCSYDSTNDELFLEDQQTSFLDAIKLIKKVSKPEEYKELYSGESVKQRIEDNYEKLSQEEKDRIRELANNSTNYLSDNLSDKEEDEYYEIYDIISKITSKQEQQEIKQKIKYNVYMRENDLDAETKTFDDEISAKKFIVSRLHNVKHDMKFEEIGVYDASKMKFATAIIPRFIIEVDSKAIMFRYPKSSFAYNDDDIEIKQNEGNNKLYFKEKDNPDSKPEKMSYWIDKYIEQKGLDKNNTEKRILDTVKSKFRNAYNSGQLTGEKSGNWSNENFPILQRCDKDGNPVSDIKKSDNKNKEDEEVNSAIYEYVLYKQDPNSKQEKQTNKDDIISMDKSDDEAWYDDYDGLDDED